MNERELYELRASIRRLTADNSVLRAAVERLEDAVGRLVREQRVCPLTTGACQPSPVAGVVEVRYDA
jgi:hypothetical protein